MMRKDGSRFICEVVLRLGAQSGRQQLGWVITIRDVSRRHDYEAELERLATHDPLTGLANRRLFEQRLDQEMADAIRHGRSLAVAILDLDRFKEVNDQLRASGRRPCADARPRERLRAVAARRRAARAGRRRGVRLDPAGGRLDGAWAAVERARQRDRATCRSSGVGHPHDLDRRRDSRGELRDASAPLRARRPGALPGQARGPRPQRHVAPVWRPAQSDAAPVVPSPLGVDA